MKTAQLLNGAETSGLFRLFRNGQPIPANYSNYGIAGNSNTELVSFDIIADGEGVKLRGIALAEGSGTVKVNVDISYQDLDGVGKTMSVVAFEKPYKVVAHLPGDDGEVVFDIIFPSEA